MFTPSHRPDHLGAVWASLQHQSFTDWEWRVLLNGDIRWDAPDDPRVKVSHTPRVFGVGDAKRRCCELTQGDVLVELDHDDELTQDALAILDRTFEPHVSFAYSDYAMIDAVGESSPWRFDPAHGWDTQPTTIDGRELLRYRAMASTPHNLAYVWYAPNHVRAFTRHAYEQAGGYDPSRTILDDQDLIARLYLAEDAHFVHVPECLYLQRMHGANTQTDIATNERIQHETVELYEHTIQPLALAWAKRSGLHAIDLGAAHGKPDGYLGLDQHEHDHIDIVHDVTHGLPFEDQSVGVIRAVDFLEHIPGKVHLFNEIHRVLAHGGLLLSLTPSSDGRGAHQDPTHCSYWNTNSFWYWTDRDYAQYVPEITARFQVSRLRTYHPSGWHEQHHVPYVQANLIALHHGARQGGPVRI